MKYAKKQGNLTKYSRTQKIVLQNDKLDITKLIITNQDI